MKMVRLLWFSVGMCVLALILLAIAVQRVNNKNNAQDRQFIEANRIAIAEGCVSREKLKEALREVMEEAIVFNRSSDDPDRAHRATIYERIVQEKLLPQSCDGGKEGR